MALASARPRTFRNCLTDIETAKLTKMTTLRRFRELYAEAGPMVGLIYQVIEKRTAEYGKFFEHITFKEFGDDTGLSQRKIQYLITALLRKGLIVRASSKISGYRDRHAYSFNWLRLSDSPALKAEFLKEYNRLQNFQTMSGIPAQDAGGSPDTRTGCVLNNNNHNLNKNSHRCASSSREDRHEEEKMNLVEIMNKTIEKSDASVQRKADKARSRAKARRTITTDTLLQTWTAAVREYWPDNRAAPFSKNTEAKIAAKLRRDFSNPDKSIDVDGALSFIRWSVKNWAYLADDAKRRWKAMYLHEIKEQPDPNFFLALYASALRIKHELGVEAAKEMNLRLHDPDPMVRERAKLEAKGHDNFYIEKALERREKHIQREDRFTAIRKQAKSWTEAMDTAKRGMYSSYSKAAKNAQEIARRTGTLVPVETVQKPLMGQTVTGPNGVEYPVEVMLYFKPAEWNENPEQMQRDQDRAFLDAVEEFEKAKHQFLPTDQSQN